MENQQQPDETTPPAIEISTPPAPAETASPSAWAKLRGNKRLLILIGVGVVVIIAAVVVALLLGGNKDDEQQSAANTQDTSSDAAKLEKLSLAAATISGEVSYKTAGGDEWRPLAADTNLAEGSTVRTTPGAHAVLVLEDGATIRLDEATTVEVESLAKKGPKFDHQAGMAYVRVHKAPHPLTLLVDGEGYSSQEAAFSAVDLENEKGVQVFHGSLKSDKVAAAVKEGEQYFAAHADKAVAEKVTTIDLAALEQREFIKWNLAEDEKHAAYKDQLGTLAKLKEKMEQARKDAEAKAEAARAEAERRRTATPAPQAPQSGIVLSGRAVSGGAELSWTTSISAPNGFKMVRSATSATPTFGADESLYVSDGKLRAHGWKVSESGTHWYRVCVYRPGQSNECTDYSNAVKIMTTKLPPQTQNPGNGGNDTIPKPPVQ